jgi:hypothetical protein
MSERQRRPNAAIYPFGWSHTFDSLPDSTHGANALLKQLIYDTTDENEEI